MSWERNFPFDKCNNFLFLGGSQYQDSTLGFKYGLKAIRKILEKFPFLALHQARPSKDYKMAQNVSYKTNEKVHFNKEI